MLAMFPVISSCAYITGEAINAAIPTRSPQENIRDVSPSEAYAIIALNTGHADFAILDVRTPEEYAAGHIPGALNRDYYSPDFRDDLNRFNKSKTYLVYCGSGMRSAAARDIMRELGFQQIYNMTGGFSAWQASGLPVMK